MLQVAKKPGREEYSQVAKVTGLGILLLGFVGYVIMIINWAIQEVLA